LLEGRVGWGLAKEDMKMTDDPIRSLAERFVEFLQTGTPPEGLFTDDVFCDFTMPLWRLQAQGIDDLVALRRQGHPGPGRVARWRLDRTDTGFVIEFEEGWVWDGKEWSSREMARADVTGGAISKLSVYCTGDWDEAQRARHAKEVTLIQP
jgi:hypothetical protein